ncbi:methyltransferase domain-containing protein [Pseudarthrobacter sp. H3Y2-7]|uniref:class I SAM-dependent methyltransferase n=1 Tax=Pseudarthrobacter naphthalenicus TaxID=3031328 RepID=UPI0023B1B5EC|nr:class I SAM-dependent methyltransferase [Pseudarthrobacter sp. H3Y2-7]MDE8669468.1 methyltransferase domain-containing protein [Pseudarthrobacter sp. H3Y2-7]
MTEQGEGHHHGTHDGDTRQGDQRQQSAAEAWDERYGSKPQIWSGKPNAQLVREGDGLRPGKALDLGCGEGADAIWLAQRGWTVTAVDVSAVALERAARHEQDALDRESVHAGPGAIASRIHWEQCDLEAWHPTEKYDLVSSHFLHGPQLVWPTALLTAAAAVKPGGTLLIVGHHPHRLPPWGNHTHPDMFYTPEQLVQELGIKSPDWQVEVSTTRDRPATGPDGQEAVIADTVLRATRLA